MPIGRFDEAARKARRLKALLSGEENASAYLKLRSKRHEFRQLRDEIASKKQESSQAQDEIDDIKGELASLKQEAKQIKKELRTAEDPAEISAYQERNERIQRELSRLREELRARKEYKRTEKVVHKKMKKGAQQEIFQLEKARRSAHEQWTVTGALPDFVIIGGKKCGTTFLYHLLGQHPLVEPAASKELHFFDALFEQESVEWYRQCFPAPRWEDGRRTITGEASPYMANRSAPQRMAEVVPEVRLIALLRNPVERTYSDYQMVARKDREHKTFEEAIGLRESAEAGETRPLGKGGVNSEGGDALDDDSEYLSRSRYAEHLLRWSEYFPREQMLVLKSEDFFDNPRQTLKTVLEFLGLPEWEPEPSKLENKRNAGRYEDNMDPATRRRLEEYFEPHNRRLYEHFGTDFGW